MKEEVNIKKDYNTAWEEKAGIKKDPISGTSVKIWTRPVPDSNSLMIRVDNYYPMIPPNLFIKFIDQTDNLKEIGLVDEFKEIVKYKDGTKICYITLAMGIFEREAVFKLSNIMMPDGKVLII